MRRLAALAVLFVLTAAAGTGIVLAQEPMPAFGEWEYEMIGDDVSASGMITITDDDGEVSGEMTMGINDFTGEIEEIRYENRRLTFSADTPIGILEVDAVLSEPSLNRFSGQVVFPEEGHIAEIQATRMLEPETHADIVRGWNQKSLARGAGIYNNHCATCHGMDGAASLPTARAFNSEEFKYGADPHSMWVTIVEGKGQMAAQTWLSAEEAYDVVQYIREQFVRPNNPDEYVEVTDEYLSELADIRLESDADPDVSITQKAKNGMQSAGQKWAQKNLGNYGKAIYSQIEDGANSALTVDLGDGVRMSYNVHRMGIDAAWQGDLDLSDTKYQKYRGEGQPAVNGTRLDGLDRMRWSYQGKYSTLDRLVSNRTPFPEPWLDYLGHYKHGDDVVLSYSIMGRDVLEMPSTEMLNGDRPVIQHTMHIGGDDEWNSLELGGLGDWETETAKEGVYLLSDVSSRVDEDRWGDVDRSLIVTSIGEDGEVGPFVAAGIEGDTEGLQWAMGDRHQIALYVPAGEEERTVRIHRFSGEGEDELQAFASFLQNKNGANLPDLRSMTTGGERTWTETVTTKGELEVGRPRYDPIHYGEENPSATQNLVTIPEDYPYVVDRITLPFDNPWNSWIRPMGFDFLSDGTLVLATYVGDVWTAHGVDQDLESIEWQRIATGLYDPYGVKVVDDEIYVMGRDRIYRLKDLNGDGETDFYESFFADTDVSEVPVQAFNFSIETDSKGNFYYAKAGQYTNNDEPGNVIRVSPDGKEWESIATGFRAPNGVTISPDDRIFVSDNQGNWSPANKISLVKEGGFYGYIPSVREPGWAHGAKEYAMRHQSVHYPDAVLPDTFDYPIIWFPQEFDNSPGNGNWTPDDWGPLGGRFLHTSFGKGWVYDVLMQEVDGVTQAAAVALPFQFDAGTQRAAVNPADGQFYVAGVTGWDDGFAVRYGSLDRIRYTGGEGFIVDDINVHPQGITITFNQPLDRSTATLTDRYEVKQWNYKWQERYGSAHWSVENPGEEGEDVIPVQSVELSNDGRTVLLRLPKVRPVDQMRLRFDLSSEGGQTIKDTAYMTINRVPEP